MATTLTNTTFLFLCILLVLCVMRYVKHNELDAGNWLQNIARRLSGSKVLAGALIIGTTVGLGSHILVGYIGPGDLFQDFVAAKEFAEGRSLNATTTMKERAEYWLRQDPPTLPASIRWRPLRELQENSINSGMRQLVVQAHPPFHVLLIAPIVAICGSIQRTYVVMTLINLAAYSALLVLLWRILPNAFRSTGAAGLLCILALDWQPLLANLRQGQIGLVVALLVIAGWYSLTRERPVMAGVLIGFAALIKMFPALLLLWLLLRQRRAFLSALGTIFTAVAALYLLRARSAFIDYLHAAQTVVEIFGRARNNYSLSSVMSYVIAGPYRHSLWAEVAVLSAAAVLLSYSTLLVLNKSVPSGKRNALEFSMFVVLSCLLSPTCEAFYYPILLLPIAAVIGTLHVTTLLRGTIGSLAILSWLSFPDQVVWKSTQFLAPLIGDRISWLLCSFPTFAMLALWYWTAREQRRCVV